MERRLGSLVPFFLFLWSRRHSEDTGKGAGMGLPVGLFLFQLEGLPCLRTGGSKQWILSLAGMVTLFPSPLTLPGIVYDVPGVLASGSGLAASA